jgi:hypothetical protein
MGKKAFVVPGLTVDARGEDGDHIFISIFVKVVDLVAFVKDVRH